MGREILKILSETGSSGKNWGNSVFSVALLSIETKNHRCIVGTGGWAVLGQGFG
jgi:hypothetical protein